MYSTLAEINTERMKQIMVTFMQLQKVLDSYYQLVERAIVAKQGEIGPEVWFNRESGSLETIRMGWKSPSMKIDKIEWYDPAPIIVIPSFNLIITPNRSANARESRIITQIIKILDGIGIRYNGEIEQYPHVETYLAKLAKTIP